MNLKDYLDQNNETIKSFAEKVGLPYVTIWRICKGMYEPRLSHYVKIKNGSGNKVKAEDLILN